MKAQLRCPKKRKDCFARTVTGRCSVLDDASFFGRPCPFYKNKEQLDQEIASSLRTLKRAGRMDLIEQYAMEPNPNAAGKVVIACV